MYDGEGKNDNTDAVLKVHRCNYTYNTYIQYNYT